MTGAAQISMTTSIFRRPVAVRCDCSTSRGPGRAWTVRSSGSSSRADLTAGLDELEPDIEGGDEPAQGPPLEGITVVRFGAAAGGLGPVAPQSLRRATGLLH